MANPNLVNVTNINGRSFGNVLTTSNAIIIANGASSGNVLKINNIVVTNVDGTAAADVTIEYNTLAAGTGTPYRLASTISVPADASLIVTDKTTSFYLEENTSLKGFASAAGDLEVFVSYEVLS
jgi:hypothetical protein